MLRIKLTLYNRSQISIVMQHVDSGKLKAVSHDSVCCINMLNWSLCCSVSVLFHSMLNSAQHYAHTLQQVPSQYCELHCGATC